MGPALQLHGRDTDGLNMVNWPLPSLSEGAEGETALVPVSISGRMGTEGDEEVTDPLQQRHLGAMVLHQLSLAASAYVSAPALDAIRTWSGIRITLRQLPSTRCAFSIDPQDLDNPLHTGDLPQDDLDLDGADNIISEWIEGYEEESMESEDSTTDPGGCENAELLHSFLAPRLSQTPKCPAKSRRVLRL